MGAHERVLASGRIAYVHEDGRAELAVCDWMVEVANDNPEPDFPSDCYSTMVCGRPRVTLDGTPERTTCSWGHERVTLEEELGPYGREWQREQADRAHEGGVVMELHPDSSLVHRPGPNVHFTEEEKHLYHHVRIDERLDAYKAIKGRSGLATYKRREASKHAWWVLTGHLRWPHRSKASFLFKTYDEVAELHRQLHESEEAE